MKSEQSSSPQQKTVMSDLYLIKEVVAHEFKFDPVAQVQARISGQEAKSQVLNTPAQGKGHIQPIN